MKPMNEKKRKADLEIHQRPKQGRFLVFTRNIYNIHILNFVFFIHGFHTKVMSQIRLYRLFNDFPTNGACSTMCSISSMHGADLTIITNTQVSTGKNHDTFLPILTYHAKFVLTFSLNLLQKYVLNFLLI